MHKNLLWCEATRFCIHIPKHLHWRMLLILFWLHMCALVTDGVLGVKPLWVQCPLVRRKLKTIAETGASYSKGYMLVFVWTWETCAVSALWLPSLGCLHSPTSYPTILWGSFSPYNSEQTTWCALGAVWPLNMWGTVYSLQIEGSAIDPLTPAGPCRMRNVCQHTLNAWRMIDPFPRQAFLATDTTSANTEPGLAVGSTLTSRR